MKSESPDSGDEAAFPLSLHQRVDLMSVGDRASATHSALGSKWDG